MHESVVVLFLTLAAAAGQSSRAPGDYSYTEKLLADIRSNGIQPDNREITTEIMNNLLTDYNKEEVPNQDGPVNVQIGMYINSIDGIDEKNMQYKMSFYFRQQWHDSRLEFNRKNGVSKFRMLDSADKIWKPDTFMRNQYSPEVFEYSNDNSLTRLNASGVVWHVKKFSATLACPMDLKYFPLDTQTCSVMFESFGYNMNDLYYTWLKDSIEFDPAIRIAQFTLEKKEFYDCSQHYTAGSFPCLEARFHLKRDSGYYTMQYFLPSILLVVVSFGSFVIRSTTARVSLSLLTALVLMTINSGLQTTLPKVSDIKAIDIWAVVCLSFILGTMIELAISAGLTKLFSKIKGHKKHGSSGRGDDAEEADDTTRWLDIICLIAFPVAFLVFNVIFWISV